ncbi:recombination protein RecT [Paenarthrobacter sp. Y-19]|uniref:recombination protein RecT n=1 Tax=Paenarthrobacter sp. Y-19 TaxID=3031125 RepID=UPI0023DBB71E|nr:recombination protein RecT [Paenarthrobacter sp. Y-19]
MGSNLAQRVQNNNAAQQAGGNNSIEGQIRSMEAQFQLAMPKGVEAAQLVRDAITVVRQNPKLSQCEPTSLLGSLMTCAQLGLRPGIGALGHAYILPFWSGKNRRFEAQFILGYQGMVELAQRSGKISSISARIVYKNDTFDVDYGLEEKLIHKPVLFGAKGESIGYYAVVKFTTGGHTFIFANKSEIEEHRDKFATAKTKEGKIFGPWVDHFDAMAQKTVLRELFKFMPKSTEIQNAIVADESIRLDYSPTADLTQVSERVDTSEPQPDSLAGEVVDESTGELSDVDREWGIQDPEGQVA